MKTTLPYSLVAYKLFLTVLFCGPVISGYSQSAKGKDGAASYTTAGTVILNRYAAVSQSANAGSLSVTVSDITTLNGSYALINGANPYATDALSKGDLVMIVQVQGASINTNDDAGYGAVTDYLNTGNYELKSVYDVSGNTILLCTNLTNSYTQNGRSRTQVIRVPRLTTLHVATGVTIGGLAWSGSVGGVVAIETSGAVTLDGTVSANAIGFRGGVDDKTTSVASGSGAVTLYRTTVSTTTAGKGEGIAGNATDYNTLLNGAYGRGAAANGGGGGNGHNSGGGGGANAGTNGSLTPWNGTGIKNITTAAWATAWNLEAASFATDVSTGAGRGGYSYSNSNQDALVLGPGGAAWGGDKRQNVGGLGGRPLDYADNTRLFMGGGGGAGDGNNSASGNGGNGGGIIFILSNGNISGSGTISANGQNGYSTTGSNIDGAGGAGAGGAIAIQSQGTITGITITANGGNGGNQLSLSSEAEGPGGGGSGGFIATTSTTATLQANGGSNGESYSAQITEFLPNGATMGSGGTIGTASFGEVVACSPEANVLPLKLIAFEAQLKEAVVLLDWITENEIKASHFEIQKSTDGQTYTTAAVVMTRNTTGRNNYAYTDRSVAASGVVYYRLKMTDTDGRFTYSSVRIIKTGKSATGHLTTYPNPVSNDLNITLPAAWQNKKVQVELYDMAGRKLYTLDKPNASQTETIDTRMIGKGCYVVRASNDGTVLTQKIIKN